MLNAYYAETRTDLRGRKLRITPFVPIRDFYQLLGAAPTPMPLASVYDALANGQIGAIDMDLEAVWKLKYYDYAETLVLSDHMMFPCVGVISGKTWLALSKEERELITRLFANQLEHVMDDYVVKEREWEAMWSKKAPTLSTLKAEAAANARQATTP